MGYIVRERLRHFLPPGTRFYKQDWIFALPTPWESEIHIKSQDAGREKLQGAGIIAAWIDEEWKGRQGEENFAEIYARRTPVYDLKILYTFTPLNGASWTLRRLWDENSRERYPGVATFNFSLMDLHISHGGVWNDEQIETFRLGYKPYERDARVYGKFSALGGAEFYSSSLLEEARKRVEVGKRYDIHVPQGHVPQLTENESGPLEIRRPPANGHRYVIGADSGGGIRRDYSVCQVWDRDDLACVATFRSNTVPPDVFGSHAVVGLGRHYNYALVVPETNGEHGGTMLASIRARQYPHIYQRQEWDRVSMDYRNEYGFRTSSRTRNRIFDTFGKYLREGKAVFSKESIDDAQWIVADEDGRPDHVDGYQDDAVVADGIALVVMEDTAAPKLPPWSHFKREISASDADNAWMGV
jgi:hypothetical protein